MDYIHTLFYETTNSIFNQLDENDLNVQKTYCQYLDKLIDAYLILEYKKEKKNNPVYTIDQVHMMIMRSFRKVNQAYKEHELKLLANRISYITKRKNENSYYLKKIKRLYEEYQSLGQCNDAKFYNEILNKQQNYYFSKTRKELMKKLTDKLPLTEKKEQRLINRVKFPFVIDMLKKGEYDQFNASEEILKKELKKAHICLSNKRQIKRIYSFDSEDYQVLDELFLKGELSKDKIVEKFPFFNDKQLKVIINSYFRILLPYLDGVLLDREDIPRVNLSFNYKDLKIYSNKKVNKNLKKLENSLSPNKKEKLLEETDFCELVKLLPLVDELEIFKLDDFIAIALNFSKIKNHLQLEESTSSKITVDQILSQLSRVIELANAYNQANERTCAILGEDVVCKIIEDNETCCNPNDYISIYLKMLNQPYSKIPPICGEFQEYTYECGNSNIERLLIGKNSYRSCLGLEGSGENAYKMVLSSIDADVLIIKNKEKGKFIGRSLLFRQGNFIILAPIMGPKGINENLYEEEFLTQIGNQMIEKSMLQKDHLDYVFLTTRGMQKELNFLYLSDTKLGSDLPHCDIEPLAYLIASKESLENPIKKDLSKEDIHLDLTKNNNVLYYKDRLPVTRKESDYTKDIQRIKVLEQSSLYENTNENYDEVYIGQDWYIALKDKEIASTGIYEVDDARQEIEISMIINYVMEQEKFIKSEKSWIKVATKRKVKYNK